MLVSGGVDSSVCAALCREAIGTKRVHAVRTSPHPYRSPYASPCGSLTRVCASCVLQVHIDHGFMRHEESETVQAALGKVGIDLKMVRCADAFARAHTDVKGKQVGPLIETTSPEHKRMIIGDTFMRVPEDAVRPPPTLRGPINHAL